MSETSPQSKEFVVLMATMMSIVAISIDAMLPALGTIGEALGVTHVNQSQYIISFIFAGMAIGQLIAGPLSDAWGRKKTVYIALAIYLVGTVVCLFSQTIETMFFGRFIQGLGVSGPYIACMSIIRDKFSGRGMARVMSLVMMIFIMVPTVAPALGQGILFFASWHYIFVMYIVYALCVLAWIALRLEETLPADKRIPFSASNITHGIKEVLGNRKTVCYTACLGCIFGGMMGFLNSCRQIFQVQFGAGEMFVVYFGILALAFGAASLVNSRLVEKLGMRHICTRAMLAVMLTSLIFLGAHFVVEIQLWMFIVYAELLLFCFGLIFANMNSLALEPMGHLAGIAAAIVGCLSTITGIALGTIIGQLYDNTLIPIVGGFFSLALAGLLIMRLAERKTVSTSA